MLDPSHNHSSPARIALPVPLWQTALDDAAATVAPNTLRTYRDGCRRIETEIRLIYEVAEDEPVPLSDDTIAAALRSMHERGLSYSTIATSAAAVRWAAKVLGIQDPVGRSCDMALLAIKRRAPAQAQADPLTWQLADEMAAAAAGDTRSDGSVSVAGLRDAAIIAVMSDGMLRVSEAAALRIPDLDRRPDGSGTILIRRDKTSSGSFDGGKPLYLGAPTMTRIDAWMDAAGLDVTFDAGVLFRRVFKDGGVARCSMCDSGYTGCCRHGVPPHPCCVHPVGSSLCRTVGDCCLHSSGPHRCCKHPMGTSDCSGVSCCLHVGGCEECRCRAALASRSIHRIITMRAEACDFDGKFSGHSLRVGTAVSLTEKNVNLPAIMQAGRWTSSQSVARYTQRVQAAKGAVAQHRYGT